MAAIRRFCSTSRSSSGRAGAASRTAPADPLRETIRGASMAPWLWPSTKTRDGSTPAIDRSEATAATASSVVSSSMVKSRPMKASGFAFVRFS